MVNRKDYRLYWINPNNTQKHSCHLCDLYKDTICEDNLNFLEFRCVFHGRKTQYAVYKLIKKA